MRLQELLNETSIFDERTLQNTAWNSPKQLIGWLKKNGFEQKGSGKFGAAFIKPGYNRIVKLSKIEDKCWIKFAKWALSVTSQPNLPNIPWMKTYTDNRGQTFFLAVVEKLRPFDQVAINNTADLTGLVYLYLYEDWFDADPKLEKRFEKEGLINADDTDYSTIRRRLFYWLRNAKDGKRFILTLRAAQNRATGGCTYDMHDGNIMYRPSNKRIVVIDPLADLSASRFDDY